MKMPDDLTISLEATEKCLESRVGGKGAKLSRLMAEGFNVPGGFCLSVNAYLLFIRNTNIETEIAIELGRKPLAKMRWEELWDTALRIRSLFLRSEIPDQISDALRSRFDALPSQAALVVRSSAPGEDSSGLSFAGLHESIIDVRGFDQLIRAIRIVWASLWSDAALLYRKEMNLDPAKSAMAAVIQEFIKGGPSGVAFSRDPRDVTLDRAIIEAVPGSNNELVDGLVEPDRWIIARDSRDIIGVYRGRGDKSGGSEELLSTAELLHLYDKIISVESKFGWAADVEWTGRGDDLSILQARPITSGKARSEEDKRNWYLTLRPKFQQLKQLAGEVNEDLLPQLRREGERLAQQSIQDLDDHDLAQVIKDRLALVKQWRKTYYDKFIPLAHGVRQLGIYYNNEVRPGNPYEFMALLQGQELLASKRNRMIDRLAAIVARDDRLTQELGKVLDKGNWNETFDRSDIKRRIKNLPGSAEFSDLFESLHVQYAQVSFKGDNLSDHPEIYLHAILETARAHTSSRRQSFSAPSTECAPEEIETRLFEAVGERRIAEAREMIELGRLSWKLRDDDNILLGRLESLLLKAADIAARRLVERGLIDHYGKLNDAAARVLTEALMDPNRKSINLPREQSEVHAPSAFDIGKPRQLVGQPAGPGIATGMARLVRDSNDLRLFKFGEVLICDAIQPTITHIVPLASAIVERRGGMLIHGAIIARELGIPCVNGVADAANLIKEGELVTVDGFLGIVTIGMPEFDLEKNPDILSWK